MSENWTPGPWRINKYRSIGAGPMGTDPIIASIEPFYDEDLRFGDDCSNARLIAAAPDLYSACEIAADAIGALLKAGGAFDLPSVLAFVESALAKARGENVA